MNMENNERFLKDPWREAILAERNLNSDHKGYIGDLLDNQLLEMGLDNCLVIGDASQTVTSALVEKRGFKHAVIVDNSPLLLDDFKIKKDDSRYERYKLDFHDYHPPADSFNFIYGKSIAFIRKDAIEEVLHELHAALRPNGIFVGVYAAEGDKFRNEYYSQEELKSLYEKAGFTRISFTEHQFGALIKKAEKSHTIKVVAYK